jgi:hypothetical protein
VKRREVVNDTEGCSSGSIAADEGELAWQRASAPAATTPVRARPLDVALTGLQAGDLITA